MKVKSPAAALVLFSQLLGGFATASKDRHLTQMGGPDMDNPGEGTNEWHWPWSGGPDCCGMNGEHQHCEGGSCNEQGHCSGTCMSDALVPGWDDAECEVCMHLIEDHPGLTKELCLHFACESSNEHIKAHCHLICNHIALCTELMTPHMCCGLVPGFGGDDNLCEEPHEVPDKDEGPGNPPPWYDPLGIAQGAQTGMRVNGGADTSTDADKPKKDVDSTVGVVIAVCVVAALLAGITLMRKVNARQQQESELVIRPNPEIAMNPLASTEE